MSNKVFINNKIYNAESANISVLDRGFLYADGVYELIPYFNKKSFLFDEHYQRLEKSLEMIDLKNPYSKLEWKKNIENLTNENNYENFSLYIQVTRGIPENLDDGILREHAATKQYRTTTSMFCAKIQGFSKNKIKLESAITLEDKRWLQCDIKSISLLYNAHAKTLAYKKGAYEAILSKDGQITEGCSSNVFIIKNNKIKTPPESNLILPGVTRSFIINSVIPKTSFVIKEENFTEEELINADEIFVTNSTQAILPIIKINDKKLSNNKCGEITKKLYDIFMDSII